MKTGRIPIHTREALMAAALAVAERDGYNRMTREAIATQAACPTGSVTRYLGTMNTLRRAVMRAAVARGHLAVIAQGLAAGDTNAKGASQELKRDALEGLL